MAEDEEELARPSSRQPPTESPRRTGASTRRTKISRPPDSRFPSLEASSSPPPSLPVGSTLPQEPQRRQGRRRGQQPGVRPRLQLRPSAAPAAATHCGCGPRRPRGAEPRSAENARLLEPPTETQRSVRVLSNSTKTCSSIRIESKTNAPLYIPLVRTCPSHQNCGVLSTGSPRVFLRMISLARRTCLPSTSTDTSPVPSARVRAPATHVLDGSRGSRRGSRGSRQTSGPRGARSVHTNIMGVSPVPAPERDRRAHPASVVTRCDAARPQHSPSRSARRLFPATTSRSCCRGQHAAPLALALSPCCLVLLAPPPAVARARPR